jgi:sec-independent protein translocase protein TatB
MFDFDTSKLLLVGAVALVVVGPKDLPRVLRALGQIHGNYRRIAGAARSEFDKFVKEADFDSLDKELKSIDISASPATAMRGRSTPVVADEKPEEIAYVSPEMREYLVGPTEPAAPT